MCALLQMLTYSPAPQMKFASADVARVNLRLAILENRGYFVGPYFVMVDIGSDWYSDAKYLIELIIIKVDTGNPADTGATRDDAIAALNDIAIEHGCVAMAGGDTQVGVMTPSYLAAGFVPLGAQFFKEVDYGQSP